MSVGLIALDDILTNIGATITRERVLLPETSLLLSLLSSKPGTTPNFRVAGLTVEPTYINANCVSTIIRNSEHNLRTFGLHKSEYGDWGRLGTTFSKLK